MSPSHPIDQRIADFARTQAGIFSIDQAVSLGVSPSSISRRVRRDSIQRVHKRIYFDGAVVTLEARRWAAVLAPRGGAHLAGESVLELLGIMRRPRGVIEIVVARRQRPLNGVIVHQVSSLHAEDTTTWHRLPITTLERALVDCARRLPRSRIVAILREAAFRELLDVDRLERTIDRNKMRPGAPKLREAFAKFRSGDGGTDSRGEAQLTSKLRAAGVERIINNPTFEIGGETLRPDIYLPDIETVIEFDPTWHGLDYVLREDRLKDALYRTDGKRVLRVGPDSIDSGVAWVLNAFAVLARNTSTETVSSVTIRA